MGLQFAAQCECGVVVVVGDCAAPEGKPPHLDGVFSDYGGTSLVVAAGWAVPLAKDAAALTTPDSANQGRQTSRRRRKRKSEALFMAEEEKDKRQRIKVPCRQQYQHFDWPHPFPHFGWSSTIDKRAASGVPSYSYALT